MRAGSISCLRVFVVVVAALVALAGVWTDRGFAKVSQSALTAQERRGKQIYLRGTSQSQSEIFAYVGDASMEMPATTATCANCHGLDGRGKPESGVVPSNITWETLTKPYEIARPGGRIHSPYTERALELAITRGLDPSGNKLLKIMPRYQMSREDMNDLLSYLKVLGRDRDPGVTETRITIGSILPTKAVLASAGDAIRAITTAYFDEVNKHGGIYNRTIELKFVKTSDAPQEAAAEVRRFIDEEKIFAMTGAFIAGADRELTSVVTEAEVPLVGPFTLYPQTGHPLNRHVFYLQSGLGEQARALVNFARQSPGEKPTVLIISPDDEMTAGVFEAIKAQLGKDYTSTQTYIFPRGRMDAAAATSRMKESGAKSIVFFLGTGHEAVSLMQEADRQNWSTSLYLVGPAGNVVLEAPRSFNRKLFLSFPTSPADQTVEGVGELRALAAKYGLPSHHGATQLAAFSAAKTLVEGLKRAGREISREKLIEALEGLSGFQTGVSPAITFGPNRRIGAMGAYVVSIDLEKKEFVPVSSWVSAVETDSPVPAARAPIDKD